jgi:hypothetical protein
MFNLTRTMAAAVLLLAALAIVAPTGVARAADVADLPPKPVKAKPIPEVPFFSIIDDRVTYAWMPKSADPGAFSFRPDGSINGTTARSVYAFSHFDTWAYGTNLLTISMYKSDHNDPASPCVNAGVLLDGTLANCAGQTDVVGILRSTFGWNELFDTKAFSIGPLRNISFEVGALGQTQNAFGAGAGRIFVGGLQFAFILPYKGYFNVAPMVYKDLDHNAFLQCGLFGPGTPGVDCVSDGNQEFNTTWTVETNYYMDLGFLPENIQYFAISGRASWVGPKGNFNAPLGLASGGTPTKTEFNSEPIRLTFDAGKAVWGSKYSHFLDVWVSYRYWQNKLGFDHNNAPLVCTIGGAGSQNTNSCTESTVYAGVTVKF